MVGTTLEDVAFRNLTAKKGERAYTVEEYRTITSSVLADTAGEANSYTTRTAKHGTFERFALPLLGWAVNQSKNFSRTFKDKDNQVSLATAMTGVYTTAFYVLPMSMAFVGFKDLFDEWVMGQKNKKIPMTADKWMVKVASSAAHSGVFGFQAGTAMRAWVNLHEGTQTSHHPSVYILSQISNLNKALSTLYHQDFEADYDNVIEPAMMAMGGRYIADNLRAVTHITGLDSPMGRKDARRATPNILRGVGHHIGFENRGFSGGSNPSPMTPHVTRMINSIYAGDLIEFEEHRQKAVAVAQRTWNLSVSEAQDKVADSYSGRHTLKNIYTKTPSPEQYEIAFRFLSPRDRKIVRETIDAHNLGNKILGKPAYFGAKRRGSGSAKKKAIASLNQISGINNIF
jgi:hypothetical protein